MKETGILFTPDNHRLILSGLKWQTRRVLNGTGLAKVRSDGTIDESYRPYGVPGDKLYIKEGVIVWDGVKTLVGYYMDGCRPTLRGHKRLTAMFMPKSMARTWLEITNVRVERVQDISEEDSIAEGVSPQIVTEQDIQDTINGTSEPHIKELARILGPGQFTAKFKYQELWDSINKAKHPWAQNPFVWVLEFRKI